MEPSVIRAMERWPNVPTVFGWMKLDEQGTWWIGGEKVTHPNSLAFIHQNFEADQQGRWFFQNGPQRVFVELEYTPLIFRMAPFGLSTQTGKVVTEIREAYLDEEERLLLQTEKGPGWVKDLLEFAELYLIEVEKEGQSESGWALRHGEAFLKVKKIERKAVPDVLHFVARPQE